MSAEKQTPTELEGVPVPLPDLFESVTQFDPYLLPESLRPWIEDIAERIQCPIDFPAVSAMTALAAVVGRRVGICPHQRNDWLVVPNLWAGVIGRPGIMKTPAIREPIQPLKQLEIRSKETHNSAMLDYSAAELVREQQKKLDQSAIKTALKKDPDHARAIAQTMVAETDSMPNRTRYLLNDCTVEKLGEILNQNPLGHILTYRDELVGFLKGLDKTGQEQSRAFYLEAWNGDGRFTYDRIGRGTIDIEAAIVSIVGGIQPGPLQSYLTGNAKAATDDGLIQRFQLLVWPEVSTDWKLIDHWPDRQARQTAHQVYFDLAELSPDGVEATLPEFGIPYLRFDGGAQEQFNDWRLKLETVVRSGNEHPTIESHLSKYRSLIPTLALLDHLAEGFGGPVCSQSIDRAIRWGTYLESHARRIYGSTVNEKVKAAHELAKRIQSGQVAKTFTARDVYRNGWTDLTDTLAVDLAAEILIDHNWIWQERIQTKGRAKTVFHCHPEISKALADSY